MICKTEYHVDFDVLTDNYVFYDFDYTDIEDTDSCIETVRSQIQDSNTLIILFGGYQCLPEMDDWITAINQFQQQIPNSIVMFNGNLSPLSPQVVRPKFHYHKVCLFDQVSNIYWNQNRQFEKSIVKYVKKHKFYWASSKDLIPRRYILSGLIQSNLLDGNFVNYKCVHRNFDPGYLHSTFELATHEEIMSQCSLIDDRVPLPPLDSTIEFFETEPIFYTDSYCSLITDTYYGENIFLSEKVYTAMLYKHIFFYLGSPGTLQYLKSQGYETFDDVIDTSYDSIVQNGRRLMAARRSLLEFLNQPMSTIKSVYKKYRVQLEENKKLVGVAQRNEEITQILKQILNETRTTH